MTGISYYDLKKKGDVNIIDIRDSYTYNLGHIKKSKNIPYYSLLANYNMYLNKEDTYYLYCDYGKQSHEISDRLNSFGYKTFYIIEGYMDIVKK